METLFRTKIITNLNLHLNTTSERLSNDLIAQVLNYKNDSSFSVGTKELITFNEQKRSWLGYSSLQRGTICIGSGPEICQYLCM